MSFCEIRFSFLFLRKIIIDKLIFKIMDKLSLGNIKIWSSDIYDLVITYGLKILYAVIVLLVGLWVIKVITRSIHNLMDKKAIDASLRPFLKSIVSMTLKVVLLITVLGIVGVEMTSFIAILGAAGLAVGLALSGTLQNFAGGVIILMFKPFKVGDFVEVQDYMGVVKEIQIFSTIIITVDNRVVIIPNGGLSTGSLINYSALPTRRVDLTFGIGYSDDIDKTKALIHRLADEHELVLNSPATFIAISELADSSVNFTVRLWVKTADYWTVYFDMIEKVKKAFDKEGISIPFPQRDVHVHNVN